MALREALTALDAKLYVRPLLTSYSALGDVHGALRLIKDAKEEQLAAGSQQSNGEHKHSRIRLPGEVAIELLTRALTMRSSRLMKQQHCCKFRCLPVSNR